MMDVRERQARALELMQGFAERTGLGSKRPPVRYLWTDAFAVCNFLGLARVTGDQQQLELAFELIDQVHATLGKHRSDDSRSGWLSGLDAAQSAKHPTRGGLRIGKPLPERKPGQPFDDQLEWDRDGQYFHYLTRWMHALDQMSRATGKRELNQWARELAETTHRAFAYTAAGGERRLYWKMSIDSKRPLVNSMGQHDALDGYVTYAQLASTWPSEPRLRGEIADFAAMLERGRLATDDPLGIGGLLIDAGRVDALLRRRALDDEKLRNRLLTAAFDGLELYVDSGELEQPAERRLAFRELGLAIGLSAAAKLRAEHTGSPDRLLDELGRYEPLRARIVAFWLAAEHRQNATWAEHRDINDVMLATALVPEGYLVLIWPTPR